MKSFRDIPGWTDFYAIFDYFAQILPDNAVIAETGGFLGRSTCYLAEAFIKQNKHAHIIPIDIWHTKLGDLNYIDNLFVANPDLRQQITNDLDMELKDIHIRNVYNCVPDNEFVTIIPFQHDAVAAATKFGDNYFDLVWLDDLHEYPHVRDEIFAWLPKVKETGWIAGHDFDKQAVTTSVQQAFCPLHPIIYDPRLHDHMELKHNPMIMASWLMPKSLITTISGGLLNAN